jgi:hypothetical protein
MLVQERSKNRLFDQILFSDLISELSEVTFAKKTLSVAVVKTLAKLGF